jgi:predicted kinase
MNISRNPQCYVLIGPPACGKSTYRETLIPTLYEAAIVSSDDVIEEFAVTNNLSYDEAFRSIDMKEINRILRDKINFATQHSHDIVIDRTNITPKARNRFLSLVPRDYKRIGVVFEYEPEALITRVKIRAEKTGKSIPISDMWGFINDYIAPIQGEFDEVITINSFK